MKLIFCIIFSVLIWFNSYSQTLPIPPRSSNAMSGSSFVNLIWNMPREEREEQIYSQVTTGNIPEFMRQLSTVTATINFGGNDHTVKYFVIPEYLGKWLPTRNALENRDYRQYLQNVYALSSLEKIPNIPEKKFVYAHLYITHQPFVFYSDGRFHPFLIQDNKAYRDQVIFLNQRLIGIIKTILAKSDPQPIVVIQSDHSYLPREDRVKILNAYYFPDGGDQNLYETITPVNTFRLVFNTYFDGNYPLLQDISHYIDAKGFQQEAPSTCVNINP